MATERTTLRFSHNATLYKTSCTYYGDWNFYSDRARSIKTGKQFNLEHIFPPLLERVAGSCTQHVVIL